jgi:hypothetical protein
MTDEPQVEIDLCRWPMGDCACNTAIRRLILENVLVAIEGAPNQSAADIVGVMLKELAFVAGAGEPLAIE